MQAQVIFPIVLVVAFAAYAVFTMSKRKGAMLAPAYERFFEQTGYRHVELGSAPVGVHAQLSEQKWRDLASGKPLEVHLHRDYHGLAIRHDSFVGGEYRGLSQVTTMSCAWSASIGRAPAVPLQIADKSLAGVGKALKEFMTNTSRAWSPIYPTRIETGDAELDKRFVVYGMDPDRVRRALAGMRELLLACGEVDLAVRPDGEVRFSDPFQKSLRVTSLDAQVPVHDRVAQLLAITARACC